MTINSLKELRALLKLSREFGVTEINIGTAIIKLGDMPEKQSPVELSSDDGPIDPYANFPQGILTPEQEHYYAMGGTVEGDPFRGDP